MSEQRRMLTVAEAYDRWSGFYDTYDNPMVFMAGEVIRQSLLGLGARRVFEFGCGTGRNLEQFHCAGAQDVSGCDLSEGMLAAAAARGPGFRLFRHDMTQPIPDDAAAAGETDLVLFSLSLEHTPALGPPLAQACRLIGPNGAGRIAIVEIHPFFSLGGAAAHFVDPDGEAFGMPAYPHQFSDYLAAFAALDLRVDVCREWRPCDAQREPPAKALKRGAQFPLAVEFQLTWTKPPR